MPWHPTVWPMVKGVNPWSSSRAVASLYSAHICTNVTEDEIAAIRERAVASLYSAHICRRVCWRYAGRLVTTSPRQVIAGQVCCGSHAIPPTPLGGWIRPTPTLPSPQAGNVLVSQQPLDGAGHVLCRVAVAKAALLLDPLRSYVPVKVAAPDASKS